MAIWGTFVVVLTLAILVKPRPMRTVIGILFVLMAVGIHGSTVLTDPSSYLAFANGALVPLYRDVAIAVVQVNRVAFGLFMLTFELVVASLIRWHGPAVRLGLWAGVAFLPRELAVTGPPPLVVLTSSREASEYGPRLTSSRVLGFIPKDELSGEAIRALGRLA